LLRKGLDGIVAQAPALVEIARNHSDWIFPTHFLGVNRNSGDCFQVGLAELLPKSGANIKTSQKTVIKGDGNVGVQSSGDGNEIHVSR
jgi:hypothetical protein